VVCPNDGTVIHRLTSYPSAKNPVVKPQPTVITKPDPLSDLSAMSTERISHEHMQSIQRGRQNVEADAFITQQMNMSHLTTKPEFKVRPGLSVGEYIVEEKLGEGGMGEVWRARQPMIDKQVALKVLSQDIIANKSSLARFLQEARSVNQIKHRNLVDIFSFGELPDGRPYFVMEYLEGKDLRVYIEQYGALPFSEIMSIFDQACRALQAAHDSQIIHRDLKPDNIYLIIESGQPLFIKILDFGIAKLSSGDNKQITHSNAVFGTPGYMAPEQCEGAKNVDHRADIYALGVILFEALTGQNPFALPGESAFAIIARQMISEPPKTSSKISNRIIPLAVEQFLSKALSKKREERPQSCTEFYQMLLAAVGDNKTETRAQMTEWVISTSESTNVNIDLDSKEFLTLKHRAPKSQLEGLVGEVVTATKALPKKGKKNLAIGLGAIFSLLIGSLLVVLLLPSEPPVVTPAIIPPTIIPASTPNTKPASTSAPTPMPVKSNKKNKK
jgi:eukaryotic-like serine/threonine-protein kinase